MSDIVKRNRKIPNEKFQETLFLIYTLAKYMSRYIFRGIYFKSVAAKGLFEGHYFATKVLKYCDTNVIVPKKLHRY